jgi:nucleoside-diphosphate-sugar epimerase
VRIAVTGASGFIGRHLVAKLGSEGMHVRSVLRSDDLREAFRGADAVVHLAAFAHGGRRPRVDPVSVNVALARSAFESAVAEGVPRFINMSSIGAVVARSDSVVSDSTPLGTVSPYGLSKREVERFLNDQVQIHRFARDDKISVVHLRPPAVYGPGMRGKSSTLFKLIERGLPLPIGGIANSRSFLYVGNLVAAVSMLLNSPDVSGAYAVSDSDPISTPEFARRIGAALGKSARTFTLPRAYLNVVNTLGRVAPFVKFPLDAESLEDLGASLPVDSTRFWAAVGGRPPFTMGEGLRKTCGSLASLGMTREGTTR